MIQHGWSVLSAQAHLTRNFSRLVRTSASLSGRKPGVGCLCRHAGGDTYDFEKNESSRVYRET
jgi:hypothetical protein